MNYKSSQILTYLGGGGGEGVALERIFFFGRSERPKNIGTDQFFWAHFLVAHETTQQG